MYVCIFNITPVYCKAQVMQHSYIRKNLDMRSLQYYRSLEEIIIWIRLIFSTPYFPVVSCVIAVVSIPSIITSVVIHAVISHTDLLQFTRSVIGIRRERALAPISTNFNLLGLQCEVRAVSNPYCLRWQRHSFIQLLTFLLRCFCKLRRGLCNTATPTNPGNRYWHFLTLPIPVVVSCAARVSKVYFNHMIALPVRFTSRRWLLSFGLTVHCDGTTLTFTTTVIVTAENWLRLQISRNFNLLHSYAKYK